MDEGRSATGSHHLADPTPGPSPDPTADLASLATRLQEVCLRRSVTLATAESCTGGLVGHLITEIPGSSGYYLGGAVSYADAVKQEILGVPEPTIARHGAVSAQVAVAMAEGARQRFGSSLGVAVTGIAGPEGGTASKPVGLTYVAVADVRGHDARRFLWTADRSENKRQSARAALELALERAQGTG